MDTEPNLFATVNTSLAGKLLVTPPGLSDPRIRGGLTLVLEHSDEGAIGLLLNRPSLAPLEEVAPEWMNMAAEPQVIFAGGPVDHDALITLGRSDTEEGQLGLGVHSVDLDSQPSLINAEHGIHTVRTYSGYIGWASGQLEHEVEDDFWWVLDATLDDVFTNDPAGLWPRILGRQASPLSWYAHHPVDIRSN